MGVKSIISEVGESGINFSRAMKFIFTGQINWHNTFYQISKAGVGSFFIVSITAIFIGLAMSTQLAKELTTNFSAPHLVGGLVGVATIRELAPVLTSLVVSGRVGAAIAAEIGSMKSSEQIDALEVLGINPIKFLLVPRLIALGIINPLLTGIAAFFSIISGMLLTRITVNLNYPVYLESVRTFVGENDVMVMILKSTIFGIIVAILATTIGMQVKGGAEAVGNSATETVVWSIILIFLFNYIITSIFFGV